MIPQHTLIALESDIDRIVLHLKTGVIRMAKDFDTPQNPLRPDKEIRLDPSGEYVLPDENIGISLAASFEQLQSIWKKGRENHLFFIDRTTQLEDGLEFNTKDKHHWMIVVNKKMHKNEYIRKLENLKAHWRHLGRYIKNV